MGEGARVFRLLAWAVVAMLALTRAAGAGTGPRTWAEATVISVGEIPAATEWTPGTSGQPTRGALDGPVVWEPYKTRARLTLGLEMPQGVYLVTLAKTKDSAPLAEVQPRSHLKCAVEGRHVYILDEQGREHRAGIAWRSATTGR